MKAAYRTPDHPAARAALEMYTAEMGLYPATWSWVCRKCGQSTLLKRHEAARPGRWWRRVRPERMRCECSMCRAVYYERPLDTETR